MKTIIFAIGLFFTAQFIFAQESFRLEWEIAR